MLKQADAAQERAQRSGRVQDTAVGLEERGRPAFDPQRIAGAEIGAVDDVKLDPALGKL